MAAKQHNAPKSSNYRANKFLVDAGKLLVVIFAIQLVSLFLPPQVHRIGGILCVVLVFIHLYQHRAWIKSLFKGRYNTKRKRLTAINVALFVCLLGIAISGFSILGTTHHLLITLNFGPTEIFHVFLVVGAFILTLVHLVPFYKRMIHS